MHKFLKSLLRNPGTGGHWGSRSTAEWNSVYTAEGLKERGGTEGRKRGSERTRGGSGGERPIRERLEEYLDQQASEG
jgi:hypothetical protein